MADVNYASMLASSNQIIPLPVKQRMLADALLQKQAADTSQPFTSKGVGYAKLAAGLLGGLMGGYESSQEETAQAATRSREATLTAMVLKQMPGGGAAPSMPAPTPTMTPALAPSPSPVAVAPSDPDHATLADLQQQGPQSLPGADTSPPHLTPQMQAELNAGVTTTPPQPGDPTVPPPGPGMVGGPAPGGRSSPMAYAAALQAGGPVAPGGAPAPAPAAAPDYFSRVRQIEDPSGDPNATSPTGAKGIYQFTGPTWKQFGGGGSITDPAAQEAAMQRLTASNRAYLTSNLGRPPTDAELYLAHQQGPQGALNLLTNPSSRAGDIVGDKAVKVNGGDPDGTAGDFARQWMSRYGGAGGSGNPAAAALAAYQPGQTSAPKTDPKALAAALGGKDINTLFNEAAADPRTRPEFLQSLLGMMGPMKLAAGETLYSPTQGKSIYTAPPPHKYTATRDGMVYDESTGQGVNGQPLGAGSFAPYTADEKKAAGLPPDMAVFHSPGGKPVFGPAGTSVVLRGEDAQAAAVGAAKGKVLGDVINQGKSARDEIASLQNMKAAVEAGGDNIWTGPLAGEALNAKRAFQTLTGTEVPGTTASEVLTKMNAYLASAATQEMDSRAKTVFEQFMQSNPGLSTSIQGNKLLINVLSQSAQRKADLSDLAATANTLAEFRPMRDKYIAEHPLINPFNGKPLEGHDADAGTPVALPAASMPALPAATPAALPGPAAAPAAAQAAAPPQVATKEQYDALPRGTLYVAPNGQTFRKK